MVDLLTICFVLFQLSRSSLLSDLVTKGVLNCATQEVKDLFQILEHESLTSDVAIKVQPLLTKITKMETQLSQYVPYLEKLAALRLLHQVSQVYQTINIDVLSRIIPFFGFPTVEKISADAVKNKFLTMKLDHIKSAVFFDKVTFFSLCSSYLHSFLLFEWLCYIRLNRFRCRVWNRKACSIT